VSYDAALGGAPRYDPHLDWFQPDSPYAATRVAARGQREVPLRPPTPLLMALRVRDGDAAAGVFERDSLALAKVTALLYLSDAAPGGGGDTAFPELGLRFAPRRGTCVLWYNRRSAPRPAPLRLGGGRLRAARRRPCLCATHRQTRTPEYRTPIAAAPDAREGRDVSSQCGRRDETCPVSTE